MNSMKLMKSMKSIKLYQSLMISAALLGAPTAIAQDQEQKQEQKEDKKEDQEPEQKQEPVPVLKPNPKPKVETGTFRGLEYEVSEEDGKWFVDVDENGKNDSLELVEYIKRKGVLTKTGKRMLDVVLSNGLNCSMYWDSVEKNTLKINVADDSFNFHLMMSDSNYDGLQVNVGSHDNIILREKIGKLSCYNIFEYDMSKPFAKGVWGAVLGDALKQVEEKFASSPAITGTFEDLKYSVEVREGVWFADLCKNNKNDAGELAAFVEKNGTVVKSGSMIEKQLNLELSNGAFCSVVTFKRGKDLYLSFGYSHLGRIIYITDKNHNGLTEKGLAGLMQYQGEKTDKNGLKARWGAIVSESLEQAINKFTREM